MTHLENAHQVAETVRDQIGHRALFMIGARDFVALNADGGGLRFAIRGSRAGNRITVALDPSDTYTVTLSRHRAGKETAVREVPFVYASDLGTIIESLTGLRVSL